jgi:transposase InsO family protein
VIAAHLGEYPVCMMCHALRVSYGGFWSWKKNPDGCRVREEKQLLAAAPNLLDQYFEADRPNSIWMADLTYIPTREGWLYLAAVMDLCTRKIVGLSMKDTLETELPLEAFDQAEAKEDLTWWIETWYNRRRLHSSLGHVPPIEYERSKKVA